MSFDVRAGQQGAVACWRLPPVQHTPIHMEEGSRECLEMDMESQHAWMPKLLPKCKQPGHWMRAHDNEMRCRASLHVT